MHGRCLTERVTAQAIAFILILAGFALGVYIWTQTPQLDDVLMAHVVLGVLTTGLAILQALAVVARPKPESKLRCAAQ